jgi:RsiW-degrading membrane proteinase PrsW (M82 family)
MARHGAVPSPLTKFASPLSEPEDKLAMDALLLRCIAGPDTGKRLVVSDIPFTLGRAVDCNLASDDPDVSPHHLTLTHVGAALRIEPVAGALVFLDGRPIQGATTVARGQQIRLGRSLWEVGAPVSFFEKVGERVATAAGVQKLEGWSASDMFSDVFKHRTEDDQDEYFGVGTIHTTPPLEAIDASSWPKPWAFVRILALSLAVYALFVWSWERFDNVRLVPGLIMVGSFAVPFSILVFFFEINVPRNVSLYQLLKLVLLGGIVSIVLSLLFYQWTHIDNWLGAASAGIVEETGKVLTLLLVVRRRRYRWILNGLLLGAAVGTGFAIFETAGYALETGLSSGRAMLDVITERGVLSVLGGHGLLTALEGGALWRVRGDRPFKLDMLRDPMFVRVLVLCMVLHMLWNAPFAAPLFGKQLAIGFILWIALLSYIQAGLREVQTAQQSARQSAPATGEAIVIPIRVS